MTLGIIGIGLIGGSAAIRLRQSGFADQIIGVDRNDFNRKRALELGLVDEAVDIDEAINRCKLLILTVPVDTILEIAPYLLDRVGDQTIIDMGSTKTKILNRIENHKKRGRYVAAHPMAGTEYSGPNAAIPNLFKDKVMVYVDAFNSDEDAFDLADAVTEKLEMRSIFMNAEEHDMHTAYVSHISHLTSFGLALTVLQKEKSQGRIFELAGSGFESTVRLAKSSPEMWAPIFKQNRDNVLEVLEEHIKQLQNLYDKLEEEDYDAIKQLIRKSNKIKRIIR